MTKADDDDIREQGVASSNLAAPTNDFNELERLQRGCAPDKPRNDKGSRRRLPCEVPFCRRTVASEERTSEVICAKHWRMAD